MNAIKQIGAVVWMNIRTLPHRLGDSLVVVVGIACAVGVLISVLSMAVGFERTIRGTGSPDRAIVLSPGALNETQSGIPKDAVATILNGPGIARDAKGRPIGEAEVLAQLQIPQEHDAKPVNLSLRGVGTAQGDLRPEVRLIEGRMFRAGLKELVVGQNAKARYAALQIGSHLRFQNADWTIVGVVGSTGASAIDSEVLTDAETLLSSYQRNWFQSVTVRLRSRDSLEQLKQSLQSDQRLQVNVHRESEYSAAQSRSLSSVLTVMGYFIGGMMAIGAVFGALNSLYATVSTRSREIATLRALGFGSAAVVLSVLVEAMMMACGGALLGASVAWLLFDGHVTSMSSGGLQGQLAFAMSVPTKLIVLGMIWACVIGLVGGLFPALRAARLPIARGLSAEA